MKYKKKQAWLKTRQDWYDRQPDAYKRACKKPGSVKVR